MWLNEHSRGENFWRLIWSLIYYIDKNGIYFLWHLIYFDLLNVCAVRSTSFFFAIRTNRLIICLTYAGNSRFISASRCLPDGKLCHQRLWIWRRRSPRADTADTAADPLYQRHVGGLRHRKRRRWGPTDVWYVAVLPHIGFWRVPLPYLLLFSPSVSKMKVRYRPPVAASPELTAREILLRD